GPEGVGIRRAEGECTGRSRVLSSDRRSAVGDTADAGVDELSRPEVHRSTVACIATVLYHPDVSSRWEDGLPHLTYPVDPERLHAILGAADLHHRRYLILPVRLLQVP